MAEAALVKAARSLDQSGPETVASKLTRLWEALVATSAAAGSARFHAAEEVALRWLLKNMHAGSGAASPEVETLRRWPLTWRILACILHRIPLFSLAKSLSERRFVAVLQQTARDLASPAPAPGLQASPPSPDGSHKRKRSPEERFDLASLCTPRQCVVSAAALFDTLQVLLARLDDGQSTSTPGRGSSAAVIFSPYNHMGAEHIKSLFAVSPSDAMELMVPLLQLCRAGLTLGLSEPDAQADPALEEDNEAAWIATIASLWELHQQGPTDAFEVASYLSVDGFAMLGRLWDMPPVQDGLVSRAVQTRWTAGLQRFFTSNLILPARSAFLNRKDTQALSAAVSSLPFPIKTSDAVLFFSSLFRVTLDAPRLLVGGGSSVKDYEHWLQTVFDKVREPIMAQRSISSEDKAVALADLLDMATQHDVAPSIKSLRVVCQTCALPSATNASGAQLTAANWRLLASIARCDADAFLLDDEGSKLLDAVLAQLGPEYLAPQSPEAYRLASDFLIALVRGFVRTRNIAGFCKRWQAGIVALGAGVSTPGAVPNPWLGKELRAAVAGTLLAPAPTKEQLLFLISQVSEGSSVQYGDASTVAKLAIFDSISAGIHPEELQDAVQTTMIDKVPYALDLVSSVQLAPEISALPWRLVRRTVCWVGLDDAQRIWSRVKGPITRMADGKGGSAVLSEDHFEAFVCCFTLWMALKFGGLAEQEARKLTWALFAQFQGELAGLVHGEAFQKELLQAVSRRKGEHDGEKTLFTTKAASAATYLAWMLFGSSRFLDEMVKSSDEPSKLLNDILAWQTDRDSSDSGVASTVDAFSSLVFSNANAAQNQTIVSSIAEHDVQVLEKAAAENGHRIQDAILALLRTPSRLLTKSQHSRVVTTLLSAGSWPAKPQTPQEAALILDLLVRMANERPLDGAGYDLLVDLGSAVEAAIADTLLETVLGIFDRFQLFAQAVIKPALANADCEPPESVSLALRLVLSRAKLLVLKDGSSATVERGHRLERTKERLALTVVKLLLGHLDSKEDLDMSETAPDEGSSTDRMPLELMLAFDVAMMNDTQPQLAENKNFSHLVKKMKKTATDLCRSNEKTGWKWKALLARCTRGLPKRPSRELLFQGLFSEGPKDKTASHSAGVPPYATAASLLLDSDLLRDYLVAETADYDYETILTYIRELLDAVDRESAGSRVAQLLATQFLLSKLFSTVPGGGEVAATSADGSFHLGVVHSKLAQRLPRAQNITECKLLTQTLRTLLADDKAAAAMGQWNIDTTLSAAALVVSLGDQTSTDEDATHAVRAVHASAAAFEGGCQLVEAVLKRHRVRLQGRFHLLVNTLQALLVRLAANHQTELQQQNEATPSSRRAVWAPQAARRFARLLELVCEPSAAAVTAMAVRGKGGAGEGGSGGPPTPLLHSATDAAKRAAGQHMYLVLMTYIKLQIDGAVLSHGVREALQPGLFSILSITPDETRRLLNDAVDASGRALFKDLYRTWLQFGKWKGV